MNERKEKIEAIFLAAVELSSPEERETFLSRECAQDPELRREVDELLQSAVAAEAAFQTRAHEPALEQAGARIGHYRLLQRIGEGGCGVVYMAEQETPVRRKVALKIVKLGMDTRKVVARFEAERQALALMDHPNIAKVLDAGATDTGRPYFVMELVRGIPITEYCDEKELTAQARLELFIQVCQAVQHAHQKGIIHRDLKPSNILVTLNDGVPVPKVIDFGIAKATEGRLTDKTLFTAFEQFIGTPAYMSPEQAVVTSLDVDTRSDIYSLGVLLYELLTGKTPFDTTSLLASGLDAMRRTICETEPDRPSTRLRTMLIEELTTTAKRRRTDSPRLVHLLSGDLDWIVMKCLEKDRTRRYATANGLAADIQRHLSQEPVVARPPSTAYRLERFVRRNQQMVVAGSAVVLILVAGLLTSTWQAVRATRAEREQSKLRGEAKAEAERAEQEKNVADRNAYAARMVLAQTDWDNNNIAHLRQILEETRDYPDRGFEWYYWQRQCHSELRTLYGHLGPVVGLTISPNGRRIATGSEDGTIKVWDTSNGAMLFDLTPPVVSVSGLVYSPDGSHIIAGSGDGVLGVYNAGTGRRVFRFPIPAGLVSLAISPDGHKVVTGGNDQTARIWDANTGQELLTLVGHTGMLDEVAFSPDGRRVVSCCEDSTVRIWDVQTGKELRALRQRPPQLGWFKVGFNAVTFSPNGDRVAAGSDHNSVQIWETDTGRELLSFAWPTKGVQPPANTPAGVTSLAFSADGKSILIGDYDTTARIWDVTAGLQLRVFKGHTGSVRRVAFSADESWLATASQDGTVKIWQNSTNPAGKFLVLSGGPQPAPTAAISKDGTRAATAELEGNVNVFETGAGRELIQLTNCVGTVRALAFSSDGELLAAGGEDNTARVWQCRTGRLLHSLAGHRGWIRCVGFSSRSGLLVTGSSDKTAKTWDIRTGEEQRTFRGHSGTVFCAAFSPSTKWLVTGSGDNTAKVWEVQSGRGLFTLEGHAEAIRAVAFSPDGRRIVTGCQDGIAEVWDATDPGVADKLATLQGKAGRICSLAFSPDSRRVLSAGWDGTARLWDASSGDELLVPQPPMTPYSWAAPTLDVTFCSDGQQIACSAWDSTVQIHTGASEEEVSVWLNEERSGEGRVAALRRRQERDHLARSGDPGAISQWLILAPIPLARGETSGDGLRNQQLPKESGLRPRPWDRSMVGEREFFWQAVSFNGFIMDFNNLLAETRENSVAYAVCYIISDKAQTDLRLKIGSDDQSKLYLNGQQVYEYTLPRSFVADQDECGGIELNQGTNVLVFKVVNGIADWKGSVRLTDKDGNPVKGISVTLSP